MNWLSSYVSLWEVSSLQNGRGTSPEPDPADPAPHHRLPASETEREISNLFPSPPNCGTGLQQLELRHTTTKQCGWTKMEMWLWLSPSVIVTGSYLSYPCLSVFCKPSRHLHSAPNVSSALQGLWAGYCGCSAPQQGPSLPRKCQLQTHTPQEWAEVGPLQRHLINWQEQSFRGHFQKESQWKARTTGLWNTTPVRQIFLYSDHLPCSLFLHFENYTAMSLSFFSAVQPSPQ